jgi:malate synthase
VPNAAPRIQLLGPAIKGSERVLTDDALSFVARLHDRFNARRRELLDRRQERQRELRAGKTFGFLDATRKIRQGSWKVAKAPADLNDRRVEITGPVERKMMINALNSGANVFMADFEDASSPTWQNMVEGQLNVMDAVRRELSLDDRSKGKKYRLKDKLATLVLRPRGWHLDEAHILVDGEPVSASLFDFGMSFHHNAREALDRGTGPYYYLPKLESHEEARLWNDVFVEAQDACGIPHGSVRATVLIETIPAAFEMEEILYELRDHAAGLNAGRWDYIFSIIKKLSDRPDAVLPDRAQVTMAVPFMRAYAQLLVKTCHARGAHAIGGMAAFVPSRKDPSVNETALAKVRADKERESTDGFDGTWVAHPDLVPLAREVFDKVLGDKPNQKDRLRDDVKADARAIIDVRIPGATITESGVRTNVDVALQYLDYWLRGTGAAAIHNLMEDAATAEISRAQLWQWIRHGAKLDNGRKVTAEMYRTVRAEELARLLADAPEESRLNDAAAVLDELVLADEFPDFLTTLAYERLDPTTRSVMTSPTTPESGSEKSFDEQREWLESSWRSDERWKGIRRNYSAEDVVRLRGSVQVEHTLARRASMKLWKALHGNKPVRTFGALTGAQAVQMVRAGLDAIYLSGWQVAADANQASQTYPDQSLYPANSVPMLVRRLNNALTRADQVEWSEEGRASRDWFVPIVADAEAGFGGPIHAFELTKAMIEAGAGGVHFEDQLASEKKCGHMGGKVLVPTSQFVRTLSAARLASDVLGVPTVIIARTDALSATLLTNDVDDLDKRFVTGERTPEGYWMVKGGIESAIARGLAYAPYADLIWCETSTPDIDEARQFAEAIHGKFPGKLLAYNCSPSFNWTKNLDAKTIASFQKDLASMGYRFQFITLAGWHLINLETFELARAYRDEEMPAYVRLQEREFALESEGYTAARHQREAGTGYFDLVLQTVTEGQASTGALSGSTEEEQFTETGDSRPARKSAGKKATRKARS